MRRWTHREPTLAAILFAAYQLDRAGKTARVQIALALDESLFKMEDVRREVNQKTIAIDDVRLLRYVAALERVGYALQSGQVPLQIVDHFYGDRMLRLTASLPIEQVVVPREGWAYFYHLWDQLLGYQNKRRLRAPGSAVSGPEERAADAAELVDVPTADRSPRS